MAPSRGLLILGLAFPVYRVCCMLFSWRLKAIDLEPEFHLDHFPQGIIQIHYQVSEVANKSHRYESQARLLDGLLSGSDRELEKNTRGNLARQHRMFTSAQQLIKQISLCGTAIYRHPFSDSQKVYIRKKGNVSPHDQVEYIDSCRYTKNSKPK